jgi:hypothetical protein
MGWTEDEGLIVLMRTSTLGKSDWRVSFLYSYQVQRLGRDLQVLPPLGGGLYTNI